MKNKKRMDNNGFSLVELIIVIAIMAVLIGVLAPQYLKYVERGRESADLDNIDIMVSAIEIYNADPANTPVKGSIKASNGVIAVTGVGDALTAAGLTTTPANMKSTAYKNWEIEFTATAVNVKTPALATALGRVAAAATPAP